MKIVIRFFLFVCMTIISVITWAETCTQNNNRMTSLVGLDSSSGVVYASVDSHSNECSCNNFRFKPENTETEMALSILLSAKLADREVRVDLLNADNCDTAYRVYVE